MRLSDKVAVWLMLIHCATFTSIGLLWPLGIPLIMRGLDRWKTRWRIGLFSVVAMAALYARAVIVVLLVLLLLQRPT